MTFLLLALTAAALLAAPVVRRWGRLGVLACAVVPAAGFAWLVAEVLRAGGDGPDLRSSTPWVPSLDLAVAFRLDTPAALLLVLVLGVGALVLVYSARYFAAGDRSLPLTIALLVGFTASMTGLALADDLLLLFVFWELTTILSYALIGGSGIRKEERRSAMQALVVTTAGGLAMLVGFLLLAYASGTTQISAILADPPPATTSVQVALLLVVLGAATKSALVPWHFWLPSAMVAPTPISAYLHAAAMVKAGVYLVARFTPAFADVPVWTTTLVVLGSATMLLGAYRALRQDDLKLLLAFGTVSQLGFLVVLLASGSRVAALAGGALMLAHGFFKATLFFVVGVVDKVTGTRDRRKLSGLGRRHPWLLVVAALAAASMAGVPPTVGFVAKESAFEGALLAGTASDLVVLAVLVLGSALTAAYSARFVHGAFARKDGVEETASKPVPAQLLAPAGVLAGASLLLGPAAGVLDALVAPYADTLGGDAEQTGYHLALWHGVGGPLLLSAVAIGGGAALFAGRRRVEQVQERVATTREAEQTYRRTMRSLDVLALRVTGATQRGSLPQYLAIILMAVIVGPGGAMIVLDAGPTVWRLWDSPLQGLGSVLAIAGALAAATARTRMVGITASGICGYGVAVLFVAHSAPDLALTQLLVETTTVVVAALVLRRLPSRFTGSQDRALPGPRMRWVLAVGVGAVLALAGAMALTARTATPVSAGFAEPVFDFGGGQNIVNVTLVDLRAWDTLGEIAVIVVAATGVASLVFLRHRTGGAPQPARGGAADASRGWLPAVPQLARQDRSLVLELAVRLAFHTVVVLSLYLLFAGHNQPGGGFAGGLVAGLALVMRYVAGGRYELGAALPLSPGTLLGSGLLAMTGVAVGAMAFGGQALQSAIFYLDLPVFGEVKVVTALIFDVGVYLVVVGLVLDVLRSLGAEVDVQDPRPDVPSHPAELPAGVDLTELKSDVPDEISGAAR